MAQDNLDDVFDLGMAVAIVLSGGVIGGWLLGGIGFPIGLGLLVYPAMRYLRYRWKDKLHTTESSFETQVPNFEDHGPSSDFIRESYALLSDSQKAVAVQSGQFQDVDRAIAITVLNRRLDFLRSLERQFYEAGLFFIQTERVGQVLRIRWEIKPDGRDCQLLGFKATGSFFNDRWDETMNGLLVIDSQSNGESSEPLIEGQTYFYTFFMKRQSDGKKFSPLRFQFSATKDESDAIQATLKRLEQQPKPDPDKENLSKALKELGAFVEMDTAFEAMEKSFVDQIGQSNYSEADRQRKIERLQDIVRQIRSKYEP